MKRLAALRVFPAGAAGTPVDGAHAVRCGVTAQWVNSTRLVSSTRGSHGRGLRRGALFGPEQAIACLHVGVIPDMRDLRERTAWDELIPGRVSRW